MEHYAAKIDWLLDREKQGDKFLNTKEGQNLLRYLHGLVQAHPKVDPLLPWIVREAKKGRIEYWNPTGEALGSRGLYVDDRYLDLGVLSHWGDWFASNSSTRRGVDIMQLKVDDVEQKIRDWDEELKAEAEERAARENEGQRQGGEVVHTTPDGWTVRKLGPEHLEWEGDRMASENGYPICVGDPSYQRAVQDGHTLIYSLRDPEGYPHVTMELDPSDHHREFGDKELAHALETDMVGKAMPERIKQALWEYHRNTDLQDQMRNGVPHPDWTQHRDLYQVLSDRYGRRVARPERAKVVQIQGRGNSVPKEEHQARVKDWFTKFPEEQRPNWDYSGNNHIEHIGQITNDPERREDDDAYEDEGGYGPHGDYGLVEPERRTRYPFVLESLVQTPPRWRDWADRHYDPEEVTALYNHARERGEIPELAKALERFQGDAQDEFDRHREQNYDYYPPYPGESWDEDPERWKDEAYKQGLGTPEEAFNDARQMYEEGEVEATEKVPHMGIVNDLYTYLNRHYQPGPPGQEHTGQYTNEIQTPGTFAKTAAAPEKPFYYRWVFSPRHGDVDVDHNWGDHHSEVGYHGDLASARNEPGLIHGYAYRIGGGWRITDWDHKAVEDPFIVRQVVERIKSEEGVSEPQGAPQTLSATWRGSASDFQRFHYGRPL